MALDESANIQFLKGVRRAKRIFRYIECVCMYVFVYDSLYYTELAKHIELNYVILLLINYRIRVRRNILYTNNSLKVIKGPSYPFKLIGSI